MALRDTTVLSRPPKTSSGNPHPSATPPRSRFECLCLRPLALLRVFWKKLPPQRAPGPGVPDARCTCAPPLLEPRGPGPQCTGGKWPTEGPRARGEVPVCGVRLARCRSASLRPKRPHRHWSHVALVIFFLSDMFPLGSTLPGCCGRQRMRPLPPIKTPSPKSFSSM